MDGASTGGSPEQQRVCAFCRTTTTPMWRKNPIGEGRVCNGRACKLYWTQKGTMRPQKLVEAALSPRPNSLTGQKRKTGDAAATPSPLSGLAALDAKRIKAMSPAGGRLSSQHVNVFAGMESTAELDTRQSLLLGGGHALLATNVARSSASGDVNADADLDAPDDAGTISPQLLHSPSLLHIGDLQDDRADSPATAARKRASRNDADWLPKSERACVNCHVTETALWRKFEGMYMCNACGLFYKANGHARPIDHVASATTTQDSHDRINKANTPSPKAWRRPEASCVVVSASSELKPSLPKIKLVVRRPDPDEVEEISLSSSAPLTAPPPAFCYNCLVTDTSTWHKGPNGETLCNPCGLYHHQHGKRRPIQRFGRGRANSTDASSSEIDVDQSSASSSAWSGNETDDVDIEQSSSEEEIDEFEQLLAMPLKQRKIAQPWQRPNPTNDEQREQERVLAEKEHELGLLIDTYDTRLRELYYMGRFMSMLEYDPVKMKAEKNEMLLAFLEKNNLVDAIEELWRQDHTPSQARLQSLYDITYHCAKDRLPTMHALGAGQHEPNPLDRLLNSFVYVDDEEITTEEAQIRAGTEAEIRDRIAVVQARGGLGRNLADRRYNMPTFGLEGLVPVFEPTHVSAERSTATDLKTVPVTVLPLGKADSFRPLFLASTVSHARLISGHYRYKLSTLRRIARAVEQYWKSQDTKHEKDERAEESRIRRMARAVSKSVKQKWRFVELLVRDRYKTQIKMHVAAEGKKELDKMLEESTKVLKVQKHDLARAETDGLEKSDDETDGVNVAAMKDDTEVEVEVVPVEADAISETGIAETIEGDTTDAESQPSSNVSEQGQGDLVDVTDDEDEVEELEEDSALPLEDLLRKYGYAVGDDLDADDKKRIEEQRADSAAKEEHVPDTSTAMLLRDPDVEEENVPSDQDGEACAVTADDEQDPTTEGVDDTVMADVSSAAPVVPVPFLLRGTLREYQHTGLDWLVSLYNNNLNGILADEMGLGKTIQTIALLAHLACSKQQWGPHLVVVPTSVILNWEMEFKRWCPGFKILPYYGSAKERKEKRAGWLKDNAFHVCITSYHLVLTDVKLLRRIRWTYLILDEAHHIKNFRSQRWQTLLGFNAQRRLLLTGTPLQNNLMELWSLMYFLMPAGVAASSLPNGFASMTEFQEWFSNPMDKVVDAVGIHTAQRFDEMDPQTRTTLMRLHTILRPYILRRLKADVEKQLPKKFEHVLYCRLSKRQRQLYDEFMSRAQTKETLAGGNFLTIINALMQLRKVCNHPDLFAERPVSSPFGVRGVEVFGHGGLSSKEDGGFARKAAVIQRLLHGDHDASLKDERFRFLESMGLVFIPRVGRNDRASQSPVADVSVAFATNLRKLRHTATELEHALATDGSDSSTPSDIFTAIRHDVLRLRLRHVREELSRWHRLQRQASISTARLALSACSLLDTDVYRRIKNNVECNSVTPFNVLSIARDPRRYHDYPACMPGGLVQTWTTRYERDDDTRTLLERFVCIHEKAVSRLPQNMRLSQQPEQSQLSDLVAIPSTTTSDPAITDPLHVVHTRQQALFPDRWLLQYDCGKLQVLDTLLRHLDANGDRCLIFTQMTRMIDVLETFLNIHGHRYLRLDGQTKPEVRHQLTERFNSDKRILCFILSTRSGGVGLNLTGANTVIFYDSDWNPAMDAQAQDRCHRIGQTRDVHIYRLISSYTIEENILKKSRQKRYLDEIVIQDANFTTDWFAKQKEIAPAPVEEMTVDEGPPTRLDDWKQLFAMEQPSADHDDYRPPVRDAGKQSARSPSKVAEVVDLERALVEAELAEDERDVVAMQQAKKEVEAERGVDLDDFVEEEARRVQRESMQQENVAAEGAAVSSDRPRVDALEQDNPSFAIQLNTEPKANGIGHIDDYMVRFMEQELLGEYFVAV